MDNKDEYMFKIPALDRLFIKPLRKGSFILIEGSPGTGKTTLAAQIIYNNMLAGAKAAYISFYETKESFYENMLRFGMDFYAMEKRGVFRFINMLTVASRNLVSYFSDTYSELINEYAPDWIVVDSITPLIEILETPAQRAMIRNILYIDPGGRRVNKIVIAETGSGHSVYTGLEYIADAVFMLKKELVAGQIHRELEIAKTRGTETYAQTAPYVIIDGVGIRFITYPFVDKIPPPDMSLIYYTGCRVYDRKVGGVPRGAQILFLHPSGFAFDEAFMKLMLRYAANYDMRTLIISFSTPAEILYEKLGRFLPEGFSKEKLVIKGINPVWRSLAKILDWGTSLINTLEPDLLILHGLRTIYELYPVHSLLYYQEFHTALALRLKHITTVRIMATKRQGEYNPAREYSDIVLEVVQSGTGSYIVRILRAGYQGHPGSYLDTVELQSCITMRKTLL